METRINIYLNGETFTYDGTDELLEYFMQAEAIADDFDTLTVVKDNEEIKRYYFYTIDQED